MKETADASPIRAVILPVGITADPVVFTIQTLRPEYLGLIGTRQSQQTMDTVFERVSFAPHRVKHVTVEDSPERIGQLVNHVYDLYHWLRFEKQLDPHEIAIDPTPGRKWMSAGATMVASHLGLPMFYVDVRFVNGKPDPDSMRMVRLGNAYDQTGFLLADRGRELFNRTHFAGATEAYERIRPSRAQEADFFAGMAILSKTLHRWDLFEHYQTSLRADFQDALDRLRRHAVSATVGGEFHTFVDEVERLADVVEELSRAPRPSLLAVADLVQNARRKILQGHYDDAVARLYRAFEAIAQFYLKTEFAIDASQPNWSSRSPSIRDAVRRACGQLPSKIANVHGWNILRELKHPSAAHVFHRRKDGQWRMKLEGLLNDRNSSILAHGWQPISARRAERMLERISKLLDQIESDEIGRWVSRMQVPHLPDPVARRE